MRNIIPKEVFHLKHSVKSMFVVLALIAFAVPAMGATVYVDAGIGAPGSGGSWASAVDTIAWPARMVGWLAIVVLLPLLAAPLVMRGLAKQSNTVNLAMLLGLTALPAVVVYAMLDFRLDTMLSAVLLLLAVGGALAYNWVVLSKLEELNT